MILKQILTVLQGTGYKIYPFGAPKAEDCIVYNFVPLINDGVKEQSRLEITVISKSMSKAYEMLGKTEAKLLTVGDEKFNNDILEISLSGGGSLENLETETIHLKAYFIVKNRYRKDDLNG